MSMLVELKFAKQIFKEKKNQSKINLARFVCSVLLLSKSELFHFSYNDIFGEPEIVPGGQSDHF